MQLKTRHFFGNFAICAALLLAPLSAHAQGIELYNIFFDIANAFFPLIFGAAVIAIVVTGFRMLSSPEAETLSHSKTSIIAAIAGLFLVLLSTRIVTVFYLDPGLDGYAGIPTIDAFRAGIELMGIAGWLQALALVIGVLTLIISSFRVVASIGSDAESTRNRKTILQVVIGVIIILGTGVITQLFFQVREPNPLIGFIFGYVNIVLGFLLIIMVAVLIYAGVRLILNLGNESAAEQAKGIVIRSIVGLILIIMSIIIIRTIVSFFA